MSDATNEVYRMERQRLLSNCLSDRVLAKRNAFWRDCLKDSQRKLAAFRAAWTGHFYCAVNNA